MERLDPDQIYDPNNQSENVTPKIKQLFRISKEHRYDTICRKMHKIHKKSSSSLLDPIVTKSSQGGRKCLTEVGQGPTQATSEPPLLIEDVEDEDEDHGEVMKLGGGCGGHHVSQRMRLASQSVDLLGKSLGQASTADLASQWSPPANNSAVARADALVGGGHTKNNTTVNTGKLSNSDIEYKSMAPCQTIQLNESH